MGRPILAPTRLGKVGLGGCGDLVNGLVDGLPFFKFDSGFFGNRFGGRIPSTFGRFTVGKVGAAGRDGLARMSTFKKSEISPTFGKTGTFDVRSLRFFSIVFN